MGTEEIRKGYYRAHEDRPANLAEAVFWLGWQNAEVYFVYVGEDEARRRTIYGQPVRPVPKEGQGHWEGAVRVILLEYPVMTQAATFLAAVQAAFDATKSDERELED